MALEFEDPTEILTCQDDDFLLSARLAEKTEEDYDTNLISPCECRGSVQFVHSQCLQHWFDVMHTRRCQICKAEYELEDRGMKPYTEWSLPQPLSDDWEDQLDYKCAIFWLVFMSRITYILLKLGTMFNIIFPNSLHGINETRSAIIHIVGGGKF
ncbi:unnamed protein product [Thelazia callipaeda]|uniref:RING-CH-type domain-containing protein n=1 Tax=Thelazia callipaeda TaxID=103827 RepID=A0A0N5D7V0_THECL|nr:unnamed protein product [Thelazia callipaeda]